jgi:hypothetical protein
MRQNGFVPSKNFKMTHDLPLFRHAGAMGSPKPAPPKNDLQTMEFNKTTTFSCQNFTMGRTPQGLKFSKNSGTQKAQVHKSQ